MLCCLLGDKLLTHSNSAILVPYLVGSLMVNTRRPVWVTYEHANAGTLAETHSVYGIVDYRGTYALGLTGESSRLGGEVQYRASSRNRHPDPSTEQE